MAEEEAPAPGSKPKRRSRRGGARRRTAGPKASPAPAPPKIEIFPPAAPPQAETVSGGPPPMTNTEEQRLALFIDFDSLAIGAREAKYPKFDIDLILERLLEKG